MNFTTINDKGSLVKGVVKSVEPKGVVVTLADDVEGYLRASEISNDRVEDAGTHFKEGDEVEAVIVSVDRKNRSIQLSIKSKDQAETQAALKNIAEESGAAASGTTNLGALLKAKLEQQ
jgi:small subunit ribosomal protein S1